MSNQDKRTCRLTEEGLNKWAMNNIAADPRQVFTIEYEADDHCWIKVWWNESTIMAKDMLKEVYWDEDAGEYI